MTVYAQGALNTTALTVPNLYVVVIPPQVVQLNGVPSDIGGAVGTASWGPVGQATIVADPTSYQANFGPVIPRKYDLGTLVNIASQQGANSFRCVRVTDGTDSAASGSGPSGCITYTAKYTGSLGNGIAILRVAGSKAGTFNAVVVPPAPAVPEIFRNISGSGNAYWLAEAAAINSGQSSTRGPSQYVIAAAGAGTTAPALTGPGGYALSGGSDGAATITAATLVGTDVAPRKGMYALRGQKCSVMALADADDSTQWTTIDALGQQEGAYMIQVTPAGDTISNAITTKQTAGLDSPSSKLMFGDWIWWNDQVNQVQRLVSPQGFALGRILNLAPNQSSLNKQLAGVVASQKSSQTPAQVTAYADADLQVLFGGGIDVITNPAPGGSYWGIRGGFNSSSNAAANGDNYTRMTNYIAATLNAGMGLYVGQPITLSLFRNIAATLNNFLNNLLAAGLLDSTYGVPFSVQCNVANNPQIITALGYTIANVQVRYEAINDFMIVNLQGGQNVVVTPQTVNPLNSFANVTSQS